MTTAPQSLTPADPEAALRLHFGHGTFRAGQLEAVQAVLAGRDVVLVMPTGSGKSLCYQLSALLLPGTTLVISPLIALMKDQVDAMQRRGLAATFLNSSLDADAMAERLAGVRAGRYKLVYVAPERFRNRRFVEALAATPIALLTVDEAHCISQWGHDFRPDYLALRQVVERLPATRVMAVTATATPEVRDDIAAQLGLGVAPRQPPAVHVHGFSRPNLHLAVTRTPRHTHKFAQVRRIVEAYGRGIVYCATRRMAEGVHAQLASLIPDALLYHGALSEEARTRAQNAFMSAARPVVVATNAFGMGVDRRDLRFVIHWDMPGSVESYYQEVGRAGRDGGAAWCELFFNYADVRTQTFFIAGANPEAREVLAVWEAVRRACAKEPIRWTMEEWTAAAGLKNEMTARTAFGILERAGLLARDVEPGSRTCITRLIPNADPAVLRTSFAHLEAKRRRDQSKLDAMLRFVDHTGCRHAFILNYFGEPGAAARCQACDRCVRHTLVPRRPPTEAQWIVIQKILSCVARMQGRFGAQRIAQVLRGEDEPVLREHGLDQLSTYGLLRTWTTPHIRAVLDVLQSEGCVAVTAAPYHTVSLTPEGMKVARRQTTAFALAWPPDVIASGADSRPDERGATRARQPAAPAPSMTAEPDAAVATRLAALKQWRTAQAHALAVPAYRLLTNRTLEALAIAAPQDMAALAAIPGMGPVLRQRYGAAVLDLLASVTTHGA